MHGAPHRIVVGLPDVWPSKASRNKADEAPCRPRSGCVTPVDPRSGNNCCLSIIHAPARLLTNHFTYPDPTRPVPDIPPSFPPWGIRRPSRCKGGLYGGDYTGCDACRAGNLTAVNALATPTAVSAILPYISNSGRIMTNKCRANYQAWLGISPEAGPSAGYQPRSSGTVLYPCSSATGVVLRGYQARGVESQAASMGNDI